MESKKIICKKCKSPYTYTTLKEVVCRKCGNREKIKPDRR